MAIMGKIEKFKSEKVTGEFPKESKFSATNQVETWKVTTKK